MNRKPRSPMQASTKKHVLALRRDSSTAGDFWIMVDGDTVCLTHQKLGESPQGQVVLPREEFNRIVRWYTRPQKPDPQA